MSQASRRGRDAEKNEENEAWQNAQAHVCTRVRTHVRTYASTYREYATTEAWQNAQAHESAKPDSTAFSSPAMARPAPHPRAWKKWRGPLTLVRGLASSQTRGPGLLPKTLPRAKSNCPADFVRTYARWPPTYYERSIRSRELMSCSFQYFSASNLSVSFCCSKSCLRDMLMVAAASMAFSRIRNLCCALCLSAVL